MMGDIKNRLYKRTSPGIGANAGCIEFLGYKNNKGYGRIAFRGKAMYAHRVAMFIKTGEWPKKFVLHSCDNPPCINPDHLREGDAFDNSRDMVSRGRNWNPGSTRTHCPQGHEYSAENTAIRVDGGRDCRACCRAEGERWRTKNPDKVKAQSLRYYWANRDYLRKKRMRYYYKKKLETNWPDRQEEA